MATVDEMSFRVTWNLELYRQPGGCLEIQENGDDGDSDLVHICDPWEFMRILKMYLEKTDELRDRDWPELAKDEKRGLSNVFPIGDK